jgi:hypothetical protein
MGVATGAITLTIMCLGEATASAAITPEACKDGGGTILNSIDPHDRTQGFCICNGGTLDGQRISGWVYSYDTREMFDCLA